MLLLNDETSYDSQSSLVWPSDCQGYIPCWRRQRFPSATFTNAIAELSLKTSTRVGTMEVQYCKGLVLPIPQLCFSYIGEFFQQFGKYLLLKAMPQDKRNQ